MNLIRLVSRGRDPEKLGPTRGRAGAWLLEQVRPDGGVAAYYKSLAALQVSGHTAAADRLCSWIVANEMTRDGDFGRAPRDISGEPKYRQMALRVRHTLAAAQRPQGYWHALDASRADVDVTAEMIVWLDAIDQAVGPGSAPSEG